MRQLYSIHIIFFFFQAEDGIRDDLVTGVQTCALPICGTRVRGPTTRTSAAPSVVSAWMSERATRECSTSPTIDRKSTRLNSSHQIISYAVFCLKKKKILAPPQSARGVPPTCEQLQRSQ